MKNAPFLAIALLTVARVLMGASIILAEEVTCQGTISDVTVDSVQVPDRKTCVLNGIKVRGDVKVAANAKLKAYAVRVRGNIQAEKAAVVFVSDSLVGGSIQIKQSERASIFSSRVKRDLQFEANSGELLANRNRIGGSLQGIKNTGQLSITYNYIFGNLQCKDNQPQPTGGGNVVQGNREEQCSKLELGPPPDVDEIVPF